MSEYRPVKKDEKIRIAFLFQVASFWPSWESLYILLTNDSRFSVELFLVNDDVDKSRHTKTANFFLQSNKIRYFVFSDEVFKKFAPHIVVLQTPYEYLHRKPHLYSIKLKNDGIRVIYIPYGIEIADTKAARHDHFREPVIRNAWRVYTLSEEFKREYDKYCENAVAVRGFGLPRFDMLRQKERFPLDSNLHHKVSSRKIIVWHTHFAKRIDVDGKKVQVTPYLEEYLAFAKILTQYIDKCFFIFLPHPRFGDDATDTESNEKSEQILEVLRRCDNVFIDTADDYRNTLLSADAIITDRSALMVESGVVGVPVLYLKNPDYEEPLFPPLVRFVERYEQGFGINDMINFLNKFLAGNLKTKASDDLPNLDGKCAERIVDDIVNSIVDISPKQQKIRLILFGTGFLYQKIREIYTFPACCEIVALTDNNPDKWDTLIDGNRVVAPNEIIDHDFDKIIILAGNIFEEEIKKQLMFDLEIPANKIEYCEYLAVLEAEEV